MISNHPAQAMPRGVANAYLFQIFNASSWSFILGTPMLLFLKSMDASAAVLGAAVAMTPLFAALQIPAAGFVEKVGYRNFVVRGWTSRSIFILGIAVVAFLPAGVSANLRIVLTLLMMACFAAARGISVCGLMPWMTQIIPETLRGAFIARDTMCMYLALTFTMLLSSWYVGVFSSVRAFGFLFCLSYMSAMASVVFLKRIPDIPAARPRGAAVRPPWKDMILFPPFFSYVFFSVVFNFFVSALGVAWVPFMKDGLRASGSLILGFSAYSSIICAGVAMVSGPVADRIGSRPLMGSASGLILLAQTGWMLIAAGVIPAGVPAILTLVTIGAVGYPMLTLASTKLLMGLIPAVGRSHFFAINSVAVSLTLGLMPIAWGFALDGLGRLVGDGFPMLPGWTWNRFSLIYAMVLSGTLFAQILRHRLSEPRAMSTEEFLRIILIQSPIRLISRALSQLRNIQMPGGG